MAILELASGTGLSISYMTNTSIGSTYTTKCGVQLIASITTATIYSQDFITFWLEEKVLSSGSAKIVWIGLLGEYETLISPVILVNHSWAFKGKANDSALSIEYSIRSIQ